MMNLVILDARIECNLEVLQVAPTNGKNAFEEVVHLIKTLNNPQVTAYEYTKA